MGKIIIVNADALGPNGDREIPASERLPIVGVAIDSQTRKPVDLSGGIFSLSLPQNTVLPSITGLLQAGQTISLNVGSWTNTPTSFVRELLADGKAVAGATGPTYTLTPNEVGKALVLAVVALNGSGGSQRVLSLPTAGVVSSGAALGLTLTGTPPSGNVGSAYSFQPFAGGGTGTKSYTLSGTLPGGLSFSSLTGAISGTPSTAGTFAGLAITVTDESGSAVLSGLSIVIAAAVVSLSALGLSSTTATAGAAFTATITGKTAGSTITASSSDGTVLTVTSGTTVSGTFASAGSPTVGLTETLAGAVNSPRSTMIGVTVSAAAAVARYFSTSGNDSGAGTQADPWKTLAKFNAQTAAGTYLFKRGDTWDASTGDNTTTLSPCAGAIINAYGDAGLPPPRIQGLVPLFATLNTGWTEVDSANAPATGTNIWKRTQTNNQGERNNPVIKVGAETGEGYTGQKAVSLATILTPYGNNPSAVLNWFLNGNDWYFVSVGAPGSGGAGAISEIRNPVDVDGMVVVNAGVKVRNLWIEGRRWGFIWNTGPADMEDCVAYRTGEGGCATRYASAASQTRHIRCQFKDNGNGTMDSGDHGLFYGASTNLTTGQTAADATYSIDAYAEDCVIDKASEDGLQIHAQHGNSTFRFYSTVWGAFRVTRGGINENAIDLKNLKDAIFEGVYVNSGGVYNGDASAITIQGFVQTVKTKDCMVNALGGTSANALQVQEFRGRHVSEGSIFFGRGNNTVLYQYNGSNHTSDNDIFVNDRLAANCCVQYANGAISARFSSYITTVESGTKPAGIWARTQLIAGANIMSITRSTTTATDPDTGVKSYILTVNENNSNIQIGQGESRYKFLGLTAASSAPLLNKVKRFFNATSAFGSGVASSQCYVSETEADAAGMPTTLDITGISMTSVPSFKGVENCAFAVVESPFLIETIDMVNASATFGANYVHDTIGTGSSGERCARVNNVAYSAAQVIAPSGGGGLFDATTGKMGGEAWRAEGAGAATFVQKMFKRQSIASITIAGATHFKEGVATVPAPSHGFGANGAIAKGFIWGCPVEDLNGAHFFTVIDADTLRFTAMRSIRDQTVTSAGMFISQGKMLSTCLGYRSASAVTLGRLTDIHGLPIPTTGTNLNFGASQAA